MKDAVGNYFHYQSRNLQNRIKSRIEYHGDSEEILSQVCATVLQQVENGSLKQESDIPRFFSTAVSSRIIDYKRKQQADETFENELESGVMHCQQYDEPESPEEVLEREQAERGLVELIGAIRNDRARAIVTGILLHNRRQIDVANTVGCSPRFVRLIVTEFQRELEGRCDD